MLKPTLLTLGILSYSNVSAMQWVELNHSSVWQKPSTPRQYHFSAAWAEPSITGQITERDNLIDKKRWNGIRADQEIQPSYLSHPAKPSF
jgi:hypothetical protein